MRRKMRRKDTSHGKRIKNISRKRPDEMQRRRNRHQNFLNKSRNLALKSFNVLLQFK